MSALKVCSSCQQTLPVEEFGRHMGLKDGLQCHCRKCRARYAQNQRANNPEFVEKQRLLGLKRKERSPGWFQAYYAKNAARYCELSRIRRNENPERTRAQDAIKSLIRAGILPRAKDCQCAVCGEPAFDYHHRGHALDIRHDVVPMCRSCHIKHHSPYSPKL